MFQYLKFNESPTLSPSHNTQYLNICLVPINKKNHVNGALQNLQFVLKNDGAAARRKILSF